MRRFLRLYGVWLLPAFTSWLMVLSIDLYQKTYVVKEGRGMFPIPTFLREVWFFFFFVFTFVAAKHIAASEKKPKTLEIIWLILGLGGTGIIVNALTNFLKDVFIADFSALFWTTLDENVGTITNGFFFISLVFVFRQLILFKQGRNNNIAWQVFEILCLIGFLFVFDEYVRFPNWFKIAYSLVLLAVSLYLSLHTQWVAFLNFKEKLMGILLLSIIFLICIAYVFLIELKYQVASEISFTSYLYIEQFYVLGILYTFFSLLVLTFNLPTSSLIELRRLEKNAIREINQAIISTDSKDEQILRSLLKNGLLYTDAAIGWIRQKNSEHKNEFYCLHPHEHDTLDNVQQIIDRYWRFYKNKKEIYFPDTHQIVKFDFKHFPYEAIVAFKIQNHHESYGDLVLAWARKNSFEEESHSFLSVLCEQAAFAIHNSSLFRHSLNVERYQEQIKIAKTFQDQILPTIPKIQGFDIHVINQEAEEIGGDYYEVFQNTEKIAILIADVSGKGTTAAFYMAELKGILQAMFLQNASPSKMIIDINQALKNCLAPSYFVTLTYVEIHKPTLQVEMVRAGHPPLLHYRATTNSVEIIQPKGIGLGIIRKEISDDFFEVAKFQLERNDVLFFFTDGITESRNPENEELGLQVLQDWVWNFSELSASEMNYTILEQMMAFVQKPQIDDDYTLLTVKFVGTYS